MLKLWPKHGREARPRWPSVVVLLAAGILVLLAYNSSNAQQPSGPLTVALVVEPTSFDPSIETAKTTIVADNTMLETLAVSGPDLSVKPWLATSWQSIGPKTWRIKLQQGVRFQNGESFNADAVISSLNVFLNTRGQARGFFNGIISAAQRVDDYTVDFMTPEPTPVLPATLTFLYMFPPKYYAQVGPDGFGSSPIGTGPWHFAEWRKGVQLRVVRNPGYWGRRPVFDEIRFRWVPDPAARVALMETGEVDLTQNIPPALVDRVQRSRRAHIETAQSLRRVYYEFNIRAGPTTDVRVRRAINLAVDVDSIIKGLFNGRAYRDKGIIPPRFPGYQPGLQPFKYEPTRAHQLLVEAGYGSGFPITMWHTVGRYPLDREAAEAIASQLGKIGITVTDQGLESAAYFSKINGEMVPGMNLNSCAPLYVDAVFCAKYAFQPGLSSAYGATDQTGTYLTQVTAELNPQNRVASFRQFENYLVNDLVPWLWLWYQQDIYAASNRLNWKARSDELMSFTEITLK
jgi:peptide/nickel transport system substrate-binding protein